jgi:hypothetical protein
MVVVVVVWRRCGWNGVMPPRRAQGIESILEWRDDGVGASESGKVLSPLSAVPVRVSPSAET